MKIDITFKDATAEQIKSLLESLSAVKPQFELPFTQGVPATTHNEEDAPVDGPVPATDVRGFPWDERIHSSNKALTKDGEWRKRRGVDDATVAAVESELQNTQAAGSAQLEENIVIPHFLRPAPQPVVTAPPAPVIDQTFGGLMNTISSLMGSGSIDPNYINTITDRINQAYQPHGIQICAIVDIAQNQQLVEYAFSLLRVDGKIQ